MSCTIHVNLHSTAGSQTCNRNYHLPLYVPGNSNLILYKQDICAKVYIETWWKKAKQTMSWSSNSIKILANSLALIIFSSFIFINGQSWEILSIRGKVQSGSWWWYLVSGRGKRLTEPSTQEMPGSVTEGQELHIQPLWEPVCHLCCHTSVSNTEKYHTLKAGNCSSQVAAGSRPIEISHVQYFLTIKYWQNPSVRAVQAPNFSLILCKRQSCLLRF